MRYIILVLFLFMTYAEAKSSMSMTTFKRLENIEALIAENRLTDAEAKIKVMLAEPPSRATDKAYLFYTAGMFYLQRSSYDKAKKYILDAYKLEAMPEKTTLYLLQTLAGLSMQKEKFSEAVKYYKTYMERSIEPNKNIYLGLGAAYFYLKQYHNSIKVLNKAINQFEPKKSIYLMLFSSHYELKQLKSATNVLEKMIKIWTDEKRYWLQLASLYIERKKYNKSLEIMQIAMTKNYLLKERDILQYTYVLYEKNLPFKAAKVLKEAITQGIVEQNQKNYELLSTMYQEAKERLEAIEALKKASNYSSDGKNDLYIAQLYFEQENKFQSVIKYAKKAIQKGIKQKGNANMIIAVAYSELDQMENAKKYLINASKYRKTKKAAEQWLESLGESYD